jgi:hypothetical protein
VRQSSGNAERVGETERGEEMKTKEQVQLNTQVQVYTDMKTESGDMQGYMGFINLRDFSKTLTFVASIDEKPDGKNWEHVSVSYHGETRKTPSWAEMCAVKEIFWDKEEVVHQIHPKESQYFHGFKEKQNILHLWRPVNGWVGFEE